MASQSFLCFNSVEAPYFSQTSLLVSVPSDAPDRLFTRCSSQAGAGSVELFAIGEFERIELSWQSLAGAPPPWETINRELLRLQDTGAALAGTLDYETGYTFEERWHDLPIPETGYVFRFLQIPCWYEVNHTLQSATIRHREDCSAATLAELHRVVNVASKMPAYCGASKSVYGKEADVASLGEMTQSEYIQQVNQIKDDILAGRFYELNFTQRFRSERGIAPDYLFGHIDQQLRPTQAFYCAIDSDHVLSFSPELYMRKSGSRLSTRPIKGSYVDSFTPAERAKLEAEHIMVVDLARNDLGRVSDLGPVSVPEILTRRGLGSLNHLESEVTAETSMSLVDILSHTYPAASITGAPKIEVVRAISSYERSRRGLYTGSCGWIWPNGDFTLNVGIRTLTAESRGGNNWTYTMGAGGAIVADSDEKDEYDECLTKIAPFIRALQGSE